MIEETESIEYYKIRKYLLINTQSTAALLAILAHKAILHFTFCDHFHSFYYPN